MSESPTETPQEDWEGTFPPGLRERMADWAATQRVRLEAWARLAPHRPTVAAWVVGAVLGALVSGAVGLVAAVAVGLFVARREDGYRPPGAADLRRRGLPLLGRTLAAMIFFLPAASALQQPTYHNPNTIDRYISILIAIPSNLTATVTSSPYPGIPLLVVASMALITYGLLSPRRRSRLLLLTGGLALFTLSPTISAIVTGSPAVHLDPTEFRSGFYLSVIGVALLWVSRRDAARARTSPLSASGASPALAIAPLVALGFLDIAAGQPLALFGLGFEATHHGAAALLAGGWAGWLGSETVEQEQEQDEQADDVHLRMTRPAGYSPSILANGWPLGARCVVAPGTEDERDVSDEVTWEIEGHPFLDVQPSTGKFVRTTSEGVTSPVQATVRLRWDGGAQPVEVVSTLTVVPSIGVATVGDNASAPADAHGCPACPHSTVGPLIAGSPTVLVNGRAVGRVGDPGVHAMCCGPHRWTITEGDPTVLAEGRPVARKEHATQHCGGAGQLIQGSPS